MKLVEAAEAALLDAPALKAERATLPVRNSVADMFASLEDGLVIQLQFQLLMDCQSQWF